MVVLEVRGEHPRGAALRTSEKAFLELKAEVDDVFGPSDVAAVGETIGLSQRKAGEILGGGPRAFRSTKRERKP